MSLCPLQTNATPTQPLFAPVGSGGAGSGKTLNVSSINASTITLNANPNDLIGNTPNAPCLNYNLGNGSTTTIYSLYSGIPANNPVAAIVTNTNNASTQPTVFERPQGLASGSLYLYPEDALLVGTPAVLSGNNGVLSINGVPYNGGAVSTVSTFATASISSLTVSSINGGAGAGSTSTFSTLTTNNLIFPTLSTPVYMNIKNARLFDNNTVSTLTFSGSQNGVPSNYVDVAVGRLLVGGLTEAGGNAYAGVIDIGSDKQSLSINANAIYMGAIVVSTITGRQDAYETKFIDANNGSTITMAQLVSSVIG
jgi:hypothetical protein